MHGAGSSLIRRRRELRRLGRTQPQGCGECRVHGHASLTDPASEPGCRSVPAARFEVLRAAHPPCHATKMKANAAVRPSRQPRATRASPIRGDGHTGPDGALPRSPHSRRSLGVAPSAWCVLDIGRGCRVAPASMRGAGERGRWRERVRRVVHFGHPCSTPCRRGSDEELRVSRFLFASTDGMAPAVRWIRTFCGTSWDRCSSAGPGSAHA